MSCKLKKVVNLPKWECYLYFIIWIASFSYALLKVYLNFSGVPETSDGNLSLGGGWKLLNRKKDFSDYEWESWSNHIFKMIPWMAVHLCASEATRYTFLDALPLCYMTTTLVVLLLYFPTEVAALFISQLGLFFIAMLSGSKLILWCLGLALIFLANTVAGSSVVDLMDDSQKNLVFVSNSWFYIRCIDFFMHEFKENRPASQQFLDFLSYIFYFPCFFMGPFIPYDHFKFQLRCPSGFIRERLVTLFKNILLYTLYYILYEISLHYFYCNAMHYNFKAYLPFGMWTVSGIGICLANFFYLKYVFVYGISSMVAKADNFKVPPNPKCIYRIHLYSQMWRYFDRGFYLFIFRNIYSPICQSREASLGRRTFASFVCFIFVYFWHGWTFSVFYWALFNYIGLTTESVFKHLLQYGMQTRNLMIGKLTLRNVRRLEALVASPLWIFAVISNFMFFGGHELGFFFVKQIFQGNLVFLASISVIAYCMCQVSIEIENSELRKYV